MIVDCEMHKNLGGYNAHPCYELENCCEQEGERLFNTGTEACQSLAGYEPSDICPDCTGGEAYENLILDGDMNQTAFLPGQSLGSNANEAEINTEGYSKWYIFSLWATDCPAVCGGDYDADTLCIPGTSDGSCTPDGDCRNMTDDSGNQIFTCYVNENGTVAVDEDSCTNCTIYKSYMEGASPYGTAYPNNSYLSKVTAEAEGLPFRPGTGTGNLILKYYNDCGHQAAGVKQGYRYLKKGKTYTLSAWVYVVSGLQTTNHPNDHGNFGLFLGNWGNLGTSTNMGPNVVSWSENAHFTDSTGNLSRIAPTTLDEWQQISMTFNVPTDCTDSNNDGVCGWGDIETPKYSDSNE